MKAQTAAFLILKSYASIVFTRYIILEWMRRNENDRKTYGKLFFMLCACFK